MLYPSRPLLSEEDRKSALKFLGAFIVLAVILAVVWIVFLPVISVGPTGN